MAGSATPRAAEPAAGESAGPSTDRGVGSGLVAVAYSGGRDSTALLHATTCSADQLGLRVVALHIHHGLSTQADGWVSHAQAQVDAWAARGLPVTLQVERLSGQPAAGESTEAWARAGRHAALRRMAEAAGADLLLLAHHRRDQAETFLLQALRGAGAAGLAAMPKRQWRHGLCWARPWLDQPRESVEAYLSAHRLEFIDDDSNTHTRFARNHLRQAVWPALLAQAPGAETALARAAEWAQQAVALQREMAEEDLARWSDDDGLRQAWAQALSPARALNALRAWLHREAGRAAPSTLVQRLMREAPLAGVGRWPFGAHEVHLYRGRLRVEAASTPRAVGSTSSGSSSPSAPMRRASSPLDFLPSFPSVACSAAPSTASGPTARADLDLSQPGRYPLPDWGGVLEVLLVAERGVAASRLSKVSLRPREGGERFQAHERGLPRALKKCWQSAGIAAPQRDGPLLYLGDTLLFAPGLGLDARCIDPDAQAPVALRWTRGPG
ncbi:tRNA lysidine(34) synthetase TilS [Roseateles amylovorans]|uniref:tRNA(Ile)-lysidine synthase n=1 Tax=Roseateles amylovorans TaxID=2978473 RepID=A0ABY6B3W4_9BURK|nr:tRNA lysidine(34) synthetase TilS [Roseateles amylovorans]UXH80071.1 tRNA lysidine(34) synthetase TilS [Roseateles amylovorans]